MARVNEAVPLGGRSGCEWANMTRDPSRSGFLAAETLLFSETAERAYGGIPILPTHLRH